MFVTLTVAFVILGILIGGSVALVWLAKRGQTSSPEFLHPLTEEEITRLLRVRERPQARSTGPATA